MTINLDMDFLYRLLINTFSILILVKGCYFHYSSNRAYAASFILFGMGVFLVTALLHNAEISMGFAFGLFAVFSMLRYRTESITIKEMTYLFLVISIALLSAVSPIHVLEIAGLNLIICFCAYILETSALLPLLQEKNIKYEKIENITPDKSDVLLQDLKARTGLNIESFEIVSVDFLTDTAQVKVFYKD